MTMLLRNVLSARPGAGLWFWGGVACLSVVISPGCGEATPAPKPAGATASLDTSKDVIRLKLKTGKKGKAKAESSSRLQRQKTAAGSAGE